MTESEHHCCNSEDMDACWYDEDYEPPFYVWNYMNHMWQCPRCDMGLSRIYDPRNSLDHWGVD